MKEQPWPEMIWIAGSDETLEIGKQMLTLKVSGVNSCFSIHASIFGRNGDFMFMLFNPIFNYIQNVAECEYDSDQE